LRLSCCGLLTAAVLLGQGIAVAQEPDLSSVKVLISDTFGRPLTGAHVTLTSIGPGQKFAGTDGKADFDKIPFGQYDLEIRLMGFLTRKERVRVYQSSVVFNTGLELAATHVYERPVLLGSIKPVVEGRPDLWVRLVAIYSSDLTENTVDSSGRFELDGMAVGRYLLLVFEKDKVLAARPVDVLGGRQALELGLDSAAGRN
jgi:hypothetical protein